MCRASDENALEMDFGAIDFSTPRMALSSSIGNGLNFTTRVLSSRLSESSNCTNPLLDYLLSLNHQGEVNKGMSVSNIETVMILRHTTNTYVSLLIISIIYHISFVSSLPF